MKVNFRPLPDSFTIDAMLDDAEKICGAVKGGALTVFPRTASWPGVIFGPLFVGADGKPKEDGMEHAITLLMWGALGISLTHTDQARRLALARHIVDEAHRVYAISLREWEKS